MNSFKAFSDVSVAIGINTYRESTQQVEECLSRVRRFMPDSNVFVFVNGQTQEHASIASRLGFGAEIVTNYGTNELWFLWWERMLRWFLDLNHDVFIKIDPDTMVDKTPQTVPVADYFGCIDDWFIQGGVVGLSRACAYRLISEKLLTCEACQELEVTHSGAYADDKYLAAVLKQIGVKPTEWPEVFSRWKIPVINFPVEFSIVHPRYVDGPADDN